MKKFFLLSTACVLFFAGCSKQKGPQEDIEIPKYLMEKSASVFSKKRPVLERDKPARKSGNSWVADKILVRVNGVNILQSVLDEPQIAKDGYSFTLEEAIRDELLFQKAVEKQILPSDLDVQRQIVALKMQNNMGDLSEQEFEKELKESGFTLPIYKRQLKRLIAVENIKKLEVDQEVVVSAQEVERYFEKNPEYEKAAYHLEKLVITEKDIKNYKKLVKKGELSWKDLGWIERDNLDKKFSFVGDLKKGQLSKFIKIDDGKYILFKLINKKNRRVKPLTNRYASIEQMLREQKREGLLSKTLENLEKKASIVYL